MFSFFTSIAGVWSWYVWRERQHAHRVHILMAALCIFKSLTLMAQVGWPRYGSLVYLQALTLMAQVGWVARIWWHRYGGSPVHFKGPHSHGTGRVRGNGLVWVHGLTCKQDFTPDAGPLQNNW